MFFFMVRFRKKAPEETPHHNTPLEVMWSVIPTLIVVVLFWSGYKTYLDMATPPQNAYEILVDQIEQLLRRKMGILFYQLGEAVLTVHFTFSVLGLGNAIGVKQKNIARIKIDGVRVALLKANNSYWG